MTDQFGLANHLVVRHFFSVDDIDELSDEEARELHDDEHKAGYPPHAHDWETA